ncbi:hypothetical protein KEHDKFFH_15290 [Marinobacter maroccanus]|uniref:Uncharacterized protein n=1 Tax=Marinobacter maroccanus TaxID=2055143 RepID=A0A2S5Z7I3_9GAMM|nr:hypothetical protein [Marinobacter maroccanus]PPI83327.1 hypothetical protein KEHDKFFH_15290 [Marinobacter maroccanus]
MANHWRDKKVVSLSDYRSRRSLFNAAKDWVQSLPSPSQQFQSLVFVYDEKLAIQGRELLFAHLDEMANKNSQILVITDVGYSRTGFYVNFDEIGEGLQDDPGYDDLIDTWSTSLLK